MLKIINKTVIPSFLVLLVAIYTSYLAVGFGSACDVVGEPCYSKTLIHVLSLLSDLSPLFGGLYIFFTSKDIKFAAVFCFIFYILLVPVKHFLGFS